MIHIKLSEDNIWIYYSYTSFMDISGLAFEPETECLSIYGLKSNIPEYLIKDNKKCKIISNHLGSPIMVLGGQAQDLPVLQMKYDSFGNIIEENGSFEILFGFAGGIWDKDTKLTRFGVRDYDAETGRWTSKEPLGFGGARNFYVYAGNDGVNYVDLDGFEKKLGHIITSKKFKGKVGSDDFYKKMDELAKESFKYIVCESVNSNLESGFRIDLEGNDLVSYTGSDMLSNRKSSEVKIKYYPNITVATGHTHPCHKNTNIFSDEDKKNNLRNYLLGRSLKFRVWNPSDGIKSNGNSLGSLEITDCICPKSEDPFLDSLSEKHFKDKINSCKF